LMIQGVAFSSYIRLCLLTYHNIIYIFIKGKSDDLIVFSSFSWRELTQHVAVERYSHFVKHTCNMRKSTSDEF